MNSLVLPASFQRHYNTERFCCARPLMSPLKSLFPGPCSFSDCQDYYGTCTVAPDGSGTAQCQCPKVEDCPSSVRELCGDDGKTYENRCRLEAESCRIKKRIEIKARGPCSKFSANLYGAFFVWRWKMVYQPMDEKIRKWLFVFPPKKTLIWRKLCLIGQSCLQYDVKARYRLISRMFSGMKFFHPNQPKATRVCVRSINQSNRSISVRLLFLFCSRVFILRSYENCSNGFYFTIHLLLWALSYMGYVVIVRSESIAFSLG